MKGKWIFIFIGTILLLALASTGALATSKCGGADIANGPFVYTALSVTQATFNGASNTPITTNFGITAPAVDPKQQTDLTDMFPGEGQLPCAETALATISALEIRKVGDASGNPISPIDIDKSSPLGQLIAGAFSLNPSSHIFAVGEKISVTVIVSNPGVSDADYGDYDIKLAAQAPGYGIGVGDGPHFTLSLSGQTEIDKTPPVVTVTKPAGDEILGVIPIEIQAYDPDTPPASGLDSSTMSATVSSVGGIVSNLSIPLTLDHTQPVAAGVTVTGTGSYTPTGGTGSLGTTDAQAFTGSSRSGIGTYTINAQAKDLAGNTGAGSKTFKVKYDVSFNQQSAPPSCTTKVGNSGDNCTAMFQFSVNRSNTTSDGAFMYDHTVVVKLVRASDGMEMATHSYGTASITSNVQIQSTPGYQTHFKRGDLRDSSNAKPLASGTYRAEVYFYDVDNVIVLQGVSNNVTF